MNTADIATAVSSLQLCALVLFYTVQNAPGTSISSTLSCDETSCVLFTCALALFISLQLLLLTEGVELVLIASWAFALLLRYPAGTQLHDAFAGVFVGSYLLLLLLRIRKSAAAAVLWVTAVCLLIAWVSTKPPVGRVGVHLPRRVRPQHWSKILSPLFFGVVKCVF